MKLALIAFVTFVFSIACAAEAGQAAPPEKPSMASAKKYDLKYALKDGVKFQVKTTRTDDAETDMMGNKMLSQTESTGDFAFAAVKSSKAGTVLDVTYAGKGLTIKTPNDTTVADFSALSGKKASFTLAADGTAFDFKGFDLLPVIDIASQQTKIDQARYVMEINELFPQLPGKPIAAGDTWTSKRVYKEPMSGSGTDSITVTVTDNYTLVGPAEKNGLDCLEIRNDFTISVAGSGKTQGMALTIDMPGNGSSTIYFAPSKGMFVADEGTSTVKGSAVVQEAALTIPMSHVYKTSSIVTF